MKCRSVAGIVAVGAAMWITASASTAESGADAAVSAGPFQPLLALDEVPAASAPTAGLPVPATWPVLRHERCLRILAVLDLQGPAAAYQWIARRCQAVLDLVFTAGSGPTPDEITTLAHTNDQWIEAKDRPSAEEVADRAGPILQDTVASAAGRYEAIFC